MKKFVLISLIFILLLCLNSCGKSKSDNSSEDTSSQAVSASASVSSDETSEQETNSSEVSSDITPAPTSASSNDIEDYIKELINSIDSTKIDSLTVMEALNTADLDDYKVYVVISCNKSDAPSNKQEFIQTSSKNIASSLDLKLGNVDYLSLVWRFSDFKGNESISYEKSNGTLSLKEEVSTSTSGAIN